MDLAQRIIKLQDNLEEVKTKKAQLEGKESTLYDQLKNDFGFTSIDEGKKELSDYNSQIEVLENEIEKEVENIEKEFGW